MCGVRLVRFAREDFAELCVAWMLEAPEQPTPPPSPPVRAPVPWAESLLAPAPAQGYRTMRSRGGGVVVKFPWKPTRRSAASPASSRCKRRFSALDLNFAHPYAPRTAAPAAAAHAEAPSE